MTTGYKEMEGITADAGIEAWGDTMEEAFRAAAEGLISLLAEIPEERVGKSIVPVMVKDNELPSLLVKFLNELIFLEEARGLIPAKISRLWIKGSNLFCTIQCVPADSVDPATRTQVKAATYHGLEIKKEENGVRIKVIFDI